MKGEKAVSCALGFYFFYIYFLSGWRFALEVESRVTLSLNARQRENDLTQSSFYLRQSELDKLKASGNLEQKLGLPLGSHAVEYDIYKAVAKESVDVFESIVAPTIQKGYQTVRGTTQSFILNPSKWDISKVETILP